MSKIFTFLKFFKRLSIINFLNITTKRFINNNNFGSKVSTDIIANNIAIPVKIPKYIVGIKFEILELKNQIQLLLRYLKLQYQLYYDILSKVLL